MSWPSDPRIKNVDPDAIRKAFFEEGLTCNEVSARFGISKGTVYYRTRHLGIKLPHGIGIQRKLRLRGLFRCPHCKVEKPFSEFGGLKEGGRQPKRSYCRPCCTAYEKEWCGRTLGGRLSHVYAAARFRARESGMVFEISRKDMACLWEQQKGLCYYTGVPMSIQSTGRKGTTLSIDRIDSSKGYTKDNAVFCCSVVNLMKSDIPLFEFKHWCRLVADSPCCGVAGS